VVWTGKEFLAMTQSRLLSSEDGVTWHVHQVGGKTLYSVATNGKLYVVVSDAGFISTSPDLTTWTKRASGVTDRLYGVLWDGTQFLAMGDNGVGVTSKDGTTWTALPSINGNNFHHGVYGNGMYVYAGNGVAVSKDAQTWTRLANPS